MEVILVELFRDIAGTELHHAHIQSTHCEQVSEHQGDYAASHQSGEIAE